MAWSEQEVSEFQKQNNKMLAEINGTLQGLTGKPIVGIFCPGQSGDCGTAMSVLKYKKILWPDKDIVWYANSHVADMLKYSPINEVRPWPWAGNGLPEGCPDFWPMLMNESDNQLNQNLKYNFNLTKDLTDGYFPCPYMLQNRNGIDYPNCSRKVFGVPDEWEWHPVLDWSAEEKIAVQKFINQVAYRKRVYFETFAGSDQSKLTVENVETAVRMCRQMWPNCAIIFSSHKFLKAQENFPDGWFEQEGILSAAEFTVRQCGILNEFVDLIISVSSGTTVACSAWNNKPTAILQLCGSEICSTKALAKDRHFELVTTDHKTYDQWSQEFYEILSSLLNIYK